WQVQTPVTFTIVARNNGPSNATGVSVSALLPSGYSVISANASTGTYDESTGIWALGNLYAATGSNEETLEIVADINATGTYLNQTVISGNEFDNNTLNNEDSDEVTTPITASADLAITKSVSNALPLEGS